MRRALLTAIVFGAGTLQAQALPDHSMLDSVLAHRVSGGFVDYAGIKADPSMLEAYVLQLASVDSTTLDGASRDTKLAFWINAYNACAIKLVVDHYPIQKAGFPASFVNSLKGVPANSIRQIPNTWDGRFCPVAGADRALDEIEHGIIRPLGEPRIHFAVNCASRSCPVLADRAYTGDLLDRQLDAAVRRFMADAEHFTLLKGDAPRVRVNKVLDWYGEDFGDERGVLEFLVAYMNPAAAAYVSSHPSIKLDFNDYDWTLNDQAVFGSGR